jgi:3-hydroxyacyl-CoA dehydrogenase
VRDIRRVAVLGAGTMGARIAAHLANAGIPCFLLDIVPKELTAEEQKRGLPAQAGLTLADPKVRNRFAAAGLEAALKARPAAFFVPESARLITIGNFEDNLNWIKDCDWVIEAVTEDREIKRALYRQVEQHRKPGCIVSSNTSGIAISTLADGMTEDFRAHFLGTHFFNPPRYLKLLEIIPTAETRKEVVGTVSRFGDVALGKGIVVAKDTPNFIANRVGTFMTLNIFRIMTEDGMTVEEVDALTGRALGLPKSATFRTLDIVGLDVLAHVVRNLGESLPNDERRDVFELPGFIRTMLERKLLGDKTRQGFYKKVKSGEESEILALDLKTFEYRARSKPRWPSLDMARNIEDPRQRIAALIQAPDRAGEFYRKTLFDAFHYAASRIPEIADDIVAVDNALKWGFGWEAGLFEIFDAVGVEKSAAVWEKTGRTVPPLVRSLLASGSKTFYTNADGTVRYFDLASGGYRDRPEPAGMIVLASVKDRTKEVKKNPGASLLDLGDGVACLEFHSKMNSIGADTVAMMNAGVKALESDFDAMVIGNQGPNFCVGANLMLVLMAIQESEWDELDLAARQFQNANMALKYAAKPVVAAPCGLTLGGGVEIAVHSTAVRAAAETYMGLVEVGVGIIPAGGGTKEMLVRAMDSLPADPDADAFVAVKEIFTNIGMAKVSTSAEEARGLGYLVPRDSISMNRDRQIADAKQLALDLVKLGYHPGKPREDVLVLGQAAFAKMKLGLHLMRRAEYISDYDVVVATELARVLSGGGQFTSRQRVFEQYLLDLEREAFLKLCGQRKTQERMQHMLKKGKPLRN